MNDKTLELYLLRPSSVSAAEVLQLVQEVLRLRAKSAMAMGRQICKLQTTLHRERKLRIKLRRQRSILVRALGLIYDDQSYKVHNAMMAAKQLAEANQDQEYLEAAQELIWTIEAKKLVKAGAR